MSTKLTIFFKMLIVVSFGIVFTIVAGPQFITLPKIERDLPLPEDLTEYLKAFESQFEIKPENEKVIYFSDSKKKTELSFVFVHGFSASRKEVSPLFEDVAGKLKGNIFFTRLTGHGQDGEALGAARVEDWSQDITEAIAIGKKIGKKVIVGCSSTGCSLVLHYLNSFPKAIDGLIMISPNFHPKDKRTYFSAGPLGKIINRIVVGEQYQFEPKNHLVPKYWTTKYPSSAIHEMMKVVYSTKWIELSSIQVPTLVLFTTKDEVVDIDLIKSRFSEIGAINGETYKKLVDVPGADDHVLTGAVINPGTLDFCKQEIFSFIGQL